MVAITGRLTLGQETKGSGRRGSTADSKLQRPFQLMLMDLSYMQIPPALRLGITSSYTLDLG